MPIDKQQEEELVTLILETVRRNALDFRQERIVGTPIESYSIANRRYVTLNGDVASRPRSSVAAVGQPYFATDTAIPMTFSAGGWRNGVGSVVAGHR